MIPKKKQPTLRELIRTGFDKVNKRLDKIDKRLDKIDKRLLVLESFHTEELKLVNKTK